MSKTVGIGVNIISKTWRICIN